MFVSLKVAIKIGLPICACLSFGFEDAHSAIAACTAFDTPPLHLTFDEPFDTLKLESEHQDGGWRTFYTAGGNPIDHHTLPGEWEVYVDPSFSGAHGAPLKLNPFKVHDGILDVTAQRAPESLRPMLWGRSFTSGLLTSRPTFSQLYGYFEIRVRLPDAPGVWPAFWMLPSNDHWPPELDVFEAEGDPTWVLVGEHHEVGNRHQSTVRAVRLAGPGDIWRSFGVLWTETTLTWFVEGVKVFESPTPKDMHTPMHLLIDLAVGGSWAGYPLNDLQQAVMSVDYVRAWSIAPAGNPGMLPPTLYATCDNAAKLMANPPTPPGQDAPASKLIKAATLYVRMLQETGLIDANAAKNRLDAISKSAIHRNELLASQHGPLDSKAEKEFFDALQSAVAGTGR